MNSRANNWKSTVLLASFSFALTACQAPAYRSFEGVRPGMDKSIIVETVGSPAKTRRVHGKDRWIYEFKDHPDGTQVREVHFESGRAIYVGPPQAPKMTAEEQDRINEAAVADDLKNLSEVEKERDRSLGVQRPSQSGAREPEDRHDRRLRESLYGIERDPEIESKKRAPVFVPVN